MYAIYSNIQMPLSCTSFRTVYEYLVRSSLKCLNYFILGLADVSMATIRKFLSHPKAFVFNHRSPVHGISVKFIFRHFDPLNPDKYLTDERLQFVCNNSFRVFVNVCRFIYFVVSCIIF